MVGSNTSLILEKDADLSLNVRVDILDFWGAGVPRGRRGLKLRFETLYPNDDVILYTMKKI